MPAIGKYFILITNRERHEEVAIAAHDHLSLYANVDEQFPPGIVFKGFRFDDHDAMHAMPRRAVNVRLAEHLPDLIGPLQKEVDAIFRKTFPEKEMQRVGSKIISPHRHANDMVAHLNSVLFAGRQLTDNPVFLRAAKRFAGDVAHTSEVLRYLPFWLHTLVGRLIMGWSGARRVLDHEITALIKKRIDQAGSGTVAEKPVDVIQWMLDACRKKTAPTVVPMLVQYTQALIFGSAHLLPMFITFALVNMCEHPEYFQPLRAEIASAESRYEGLEAVNHLPLMDSFLKETARFDPPAICKFLGFPDAQDETVC